MEVSQVTTTTTAILPKSLCRIIRAVNYMIRKAVSKKRHLMVDIHILLKRGKIAGKAIGNNIVFYAHQHSSNNQHSTSFHHPHAGEVEFSCSSTPSYPSFHPAKGSKKHGRRGLDAAAFKKAFEVLKEIPDLSPFHDDADSNERSIVAFPSPLPAFWNYKKSPATVRKVPTMDSPFLLREEEGGDDGRVDEKAEAFIARFYQQLRHQQERMANIEATGFCC